jgi:hypothetical protein
MMPTVVRSEASMRYLLAVFTLISTATMTTGARADDCKPVLDALVRIVTVPNHAMVTSRALGKFETVHTENALYETSGGAWKRLPYNDADEASLKVVSFRNKKADCTLRGTETINGQAVQHYAVTEHLKVGEALDEIWISNAAGLVLKSTTKFPADDVTTIYDYTDIKAPL